MVQKHGQTSSLTHTQNEIKTKQIGMKNVNLVEINKKVKMNVGHS